MLALLILIKKGSLLKVDFAWSESSHTQARAMPFPQQQRILGKPLAAYACFAAALRVAALLNCGEMFRRAAPAAVQARCVY